VQVDPPYNLAQILINVSCLGFVIFIGISTIIPMVYELILRGYDNREHFGYLVRQYPYRLISRMGERWVISIFLLFSISFLFLGFFTLMCLYFEFSQILVTILLFEVVIWLVVLIFVIILIIYGLIYKKEEFDRIIEYSEP